VTLARETPFLYDEMRVRSFLVFARHLYDNWNCSFAEDWLRRMRIDPERRIGELSKGTKVKLALLLGLAHDSRLVLLDEPTAGLDPNARRDLQDILRTMLKEKGIYLVLSSHFFEDIERVADEVIMIRGGQITFRSSVDRLGSIFLYTVAGSHGIGTPSHPEVLEMWRSGAETCLLVDESCPAGAWREEAAGRGAGRRPASLTDLYFAIGEKRQ
jgi:ABC-type multidrug transport system ATPase subunit